MVQLLLVQVVVFPHEMLHWLTAWVCRLHPKYDARRMMVTHDTCPRWQYFLIGIAPFAGGSLLLLLSSFIVVATYPERRADFAAIGIVIAISILLGCLYDLVQLTQLFLSPDTQLPEKDS